MNRPNSVTIGTCDKGCHVVVIFREDGKQASAILDEEETQGLIDCLTGQFAEVKAKIAIVEGSA